MFRTFFRLLIIGSLLLAPTAVTAKDHTLDDVTHGGYGALAGALAFSLLSLTAGNLGRVIYSPPSDADCRVETERCEPSALDHVLMGTLVAAALAGTYGAGYGASKFAKSQGWDPLLGWSLAGGYLGVPVSLLLQNAIPDFDPEWLRQSLGFAVAAGGAVGAGYAFRAIAERRGESLDPPAGQAWPEFGFGVGGMALGLSLGSVFFRNTVWVPILGGVTAVLASSAAALAFE